MRHRRSLLVLVASTALVTNACVEQFDLSVGAGLGIRWGTPVGPLWADVAWPIANRGTNEGARFSFGIGRTF